METRAVARYVRISPRKARAVVNLIRGEDLERAKQILEYSSKVAARIVLKVLMSAQANAENNNKLRAENLYVARAFVDEGPTLKRYRPRAMGRATRINKRTSHITIVLEEKEKEEEKAARSRRAEKTVSKKAEGADKQKKEKSKRGPETKKTKKEAPESEKAAKLEKSEDETREGRGE